MNILLESLLYLIVKGRHSEFFSLQYVQDDSSRNVWPSLVLKTFVPDAFSRNVSLKFLPLFHQRNVIISLRLRYVCMSYLCFVMRLL